MDAYNEYTKRGKLLENDVQVAALRELMIAHHHENGDENTFYVAVGSSGVGKTQLAFALRNEALRVIHLVCATPVDQKVYEYNSALHRQFMEMVKRDCTGLNEPPSTNDPVWKQPLYTCGFLAALANRAMGASDEPFSRRKVREARLEIRRKAVIPIAIMLDEVPQLPPQPSNTLKQSANGKHADESAIRFCFIRNVCRLMGFITILSGSNLSLSNYFDKRMNSSGQRHNGPRIWCRIITKFPSSHRQLVNVPPHRLA